MKTVFLLAAGAFLLPGLGLAVEEEPLDDPTTRLSYSLGHQIGEDLKRQGTEVHPDALEGGVRDGLSGIAPAVDPEQMRQILGELKNKVVANQRVQKEKAVEGYRGEGREFLAANAEKEGVVSLPSGLQYQVLVTGSGKTPGPDDTVTVHYRGTTLDGAVFYDSHRGEGHPARFHVGAVIRGMSEALQLMREGDTWRLFVPADLAYGERGPLADRALIFEVELVSVQPGADPQAGVNPR